MSSIIRMRNGVMGGLLLELTDGISPELEKYPQQSRLTMISPLYGEAVQSNERMRKGVPTVAKQENFPFETLFQNQGKR